MTQVNIWVEFEFRIVHHSMSWEIPLQFVDLRFHEQWHSFGVPRQPSCSGSIAWLGSHPILATRKDATVEVVLATCHKCSSKMCLLFGPFGPTSLQQKAAAQESHLWDSLRLAESKMVLSLSRDSVVQKRCRRQRPVFPRRSRFVLGKLCFSDCWFEISWTVA